MLDERSRYTLAPSLSICRALIGMWQVAGGHGVIDADAAVEDMAAYVDAGFTTFDLADHYGPAEDLIGGLRDFLKAQRGGRALGTVNVLTKWVPSPGPMPRVKVQAAVSRSMRRMRVSALDVLQFHWWDYEDNRYLDALDELARLRSEGLIRELGLTNFDTQRLEKIRKRGIPVVSNQVQYSLVDRRPEVRMAPFCKQEGVGLLTYGTLCGGLLAERYLNAREPSRGDLDTVSLRKYKPMVDAWGDWALFQQLLRTLKGIAERHKVSISNVAVRYIMERPAVAGVIIGARLGVAEHREENARVFGFSLDPEDYRSIEGVLAKSRDLYQSIGDCGDEYRR